VKKKIIGILIAVALLGVAAFQVAPAFADTAGPLDHVVLTPSGATLLPGGTQQFVAQAYDASNAAVAGVSYFWMAGTGSVTSTGPNTATYTAVTTSGVYPTAVEVIAVQGSTAKTAYASVTVTATAGTLDHVVITPASVTVVVGGTKQFSAQAYDVSNIAITGLNYTWSIVANGGSIGMTTGLFQAGTATGNYPGTVQVSTTQGLITETATASVTVVATPQSQTENESAVKPNVNKLTSLFNAYIKGIGFENFYGGQWTVKENGTVNTYKVIPGVVKAVSATVLTILPNGQTTNVDFALPAGTSILPKNSTLTVNDKVFAVTVNDQVKLVYKLSTTTTGNMPPGLQKNGNGRDEGKATPPGWDKGKKVGWSKGTETGTDVQD
jgi:hypothetical protein